MLISFPYEVIKSNMHYFKRIGLENHLFYKSGIDATLKIYILRFKFLIAINLYYLFMEMKKNASN